MTDSDSLAIAGVGLLAIGAVVLLGATGAHPLALLLALVAFWCVGVAGMVDLARPTTA
jgi:hypothetical protein